MIYERVKWVGESIDYDGTESKTDTRVGLLTI